MDPHGPNNHIYPPRLANDCLILSVHGKVGQRPGASLLNPGIISVDLHRTNDGVNTTNVSDEHLLVVVVGAEVPQGTERLLLQLDVPGVHYHGYDDSIGPAGGGDGRLDGRLLRGEVGKGGTALLLNAGVLGVAVHGLDDLPHPVVFNDDGMVSLAGAEVGERRHGVLLHVGITLEGNHRVKDGNDAPRGTDGGLIVRRRA
mmetsp:Transcript_22720/g.49318  ORF Transcript_22720/g.49318 Transcript_22720/m.49318 type:complete len:201 (-) Transcript_22720:1135-1737(-)